MRGHYYLTEQEKEEYIPYIKILIDNEATDFSLTHTTLNLMNMREILEELGYEEVSSETNGWQGDFWYTFTKPGDDLRVIVAGDCVTCDLRIYTER